MRQRLRVDARRGEEVGWGKGAQEGACTQVLRGFARQRATLLRTGGARVLDILNMNGRGVLAEQSRAPRTQYLCNLRSCKATGKGALRWRRTHKSQLQDGQARVKDELQHHDLPDDEPWVKRLHAHGWCRCGHSQLKLRFVAQRIRCMGTAHGKRMQRMSERCDCDACIQAETADTGVHQRGARALLKEPGVPLTLRLFVACHSA